MFGTLFGGTIYSMTDPFYVILLTRYFGTQSYEIWDQEATVRFLRPIRETVTATFSLAGELLDSIERDLRLRGISQPEVEVFVKNSQGKLMAKATKKLFIRQRELIATS